MLTTHTFETHFQSFECKDDLKEYQKELIEKTIQNLHNAYAPYSKFQVSCAVLLSNNNVYLGSNQENASYPVGACAEQVALRWVHANFSNETIKSIAIVAQGEGSTEPVLAAPCGMCRQCIFEYEFKQKSAIEILLSSTNWSGRIWAKAAYLLPMPFDGSEL